MKATYRDGASGSSLLVETSKGGWKFYTTEEADRMVQKLRTRLKVREHLSQPGFGTFFMVLVSQ